MVHSPGPSADLDRDANPRSPSTATLFRLRASTGDLASLAAAVTGALDAAVVGLNAENRVVVWNRAAESLLGLPAAATIGRSITTLGIAPTGAFEEILPELLRRAGVTSFTPRSRFDGPDGPVHTLGLSADADRPVTDSERSEVANSRHDESRENLLERRLRLILAAAADAIVTIDAQGLIESFNPAAERMFGFAASEVVGTNVSRLMPPPQCHEHNGYLARYRDTHVPHLIGTVRELVARRKDGSRFPIELSVSEDATGRQFTGIVRDVSERKMLQEQLLTIAENEKRRIGQDLHDDIGQEMAGLGLTAETLLEALDEYALPEAELAARLAQAVRRTLHKLRRLSRGLLPLEVDAHQFVPALIELTAQLELADGIRCTFQCATPVTLADNRVATQLYRIAQEATANAVRHAGAQHIEVVLSIEDHCFVLAIRDDGLGIGQGLDAPGNGLQIMRHRAGLIGATLSIVSPPGGGTTVTCRMPDVTRFVAEHTDMEGPAHER